MKALALSRDEKLMLAKAQEDAARYRKLKDMLDNEEVTAKLHEAFQAGSDALDSALDSAMQAEKDKP